MPFVPAEVRRLVRAVVAASVGLAVVKIGAGIAGRSDALVADGIESSVDVATGLAVWGGLRLAVQPADRRHPYGHGKAEPLAGAAVALLVLAAAAAVAVRGVRAIGEPGPVPAGYTLAVLAAVILFKEGIYRLLHRAGRRLDSRALLAEAWHHRGDALTSLAAFVGITLALWGGPRWAAADDWAALAAAGVIAVNGATLLRRAVDELMDASAHPELVERIRSLAGAEPGVARIEKCRVRKSGLALLLDIHVQVPGETSVREGHELGHRVQERLLASELPIADVVVHLEPADEPPHER